ncbi:Remorin, C-terminal [Quillaja saponaria]|uniref:Remorin, C-terminal n=1 Tax=Quillaja saponaria TaxID=32244 RepID=A0AAD7L4T4_QUISA|nr:Remorin, C-terminal [Quillaja saponaria]
MQEMESQQPTFKNSKKNHPRKMMNRMATCTDSIPCNMNYMTVSNSKKMGSHKARSARTLITNSKSKIRIAQHPESSRGDPVWSMSSLVAYLPESPSPICSSGPSQMSNGTGSQKSDTFYSEIRTEFSYPGNQSIRRISIDNKQSPSTVEVDEWMKHATKFCHASNFYSNYLEETGFLKQNGSPEGNMSMSSLCKTFFTAPDHELSSLTLPSVREGSSVPEDLSRHVCIHSIYGASNSRSPMDERRKLIKRPKPYNTFLDEVMTQKLEAETDSRSKAKHVKVMDKMRRKVAATDDWESKETRKAMMERKELESKLERKRIQVLNRTEERIFKVKEMAKKQKMNARRSAMAKISSSSNISSTPHQRDSACLRLVPFF